MAGQKVLNHGTSYRPDRPQRFRARIRKRGLNPYVDVPTNVSRAFADYGGAAPESRRRRIQKTIEHVAGKDTPSERPRPSRPLWTCPRCGNEFVNRNQYHSCRRRSLEEPFAGKPAHIRALFDRFRSMVEACGPVKLLPYRDKVGFMVRVRFAGAFPRTRWLEIGLWLPRRIEHPRFSRIETIYPKAHVHRLRVTEPSQLDRELAGWLKEAYAVGCQEHLGSR